MNDEKQEENLLYELEKAYEQWQKLYEYGGDDPFYEDGSCLNSIRDEIRSLKWRIDDERPQDMKSDAYKCPLPPKVDPNYMARADEIREHARESLARYKTDPDYLYLWSHKNILTPAEKERTDISVTLGCVSRLELAIYDDDLLSMRCHETPNALIQSFQNCARQVHDVFENQELNLFTMAAEAECEEEEPEVSLGMEMGMM